MSINPKFIDVEFDRWRPGQEYGGLIESKEEESYGRAFPDKFLVPRSDWREAIHEIQKKGIELKRFHPYVYNQSPESTCVYNSACGCYTIRRNIQLGLHNQIVTSPLSGYCQVTNSRHSGSTMWGAMKILTEVGVLPSDKHNQQRLFHHVLHENTPFIRRNRLPDGWRNTARHFRVADDGWFRIDSKEQFASALLNQMPICYGRSGHSICAEDLHYVDGRFLVSYCDSYSKRRGRDGRLYDSERMWSTGGAWACAYVLRPDDISRPAGDDGKEVSL